MQSTGWTFRAQSAVAAGTTSLTITKPSGTADNDIMLMWLTHKGASYATVPAGWTLVAQNISGSTRGELYWKRAASEGASYSITGLADTALGMIASYIGGLLSGNVVDVSDSIANASGTRTSPQVTPTVPNTLIVSSVHVGANSSVGTQGTGQSQGNTNFFTNFGEWDEQLLRIRTLTDTGTNNGSDCRLAVADAGKPFPDVTGALAVSSAYTGENVRIVAAFIPDTTQPSVGTRYYMGLEVPIGTLRINEVPAGDWDSEAYGPNNYGNFGIVGQLTQNKTLAWHMVEGSSAPGNFVTNRQGNYDELIGRFVSMPLEAQTISGTIDISLKVRALFLDSVFFFNNSCHCVYKLHVYITQGQTGIVRHVLLDNYVDTTLWPRFNTGGVGGAGAQSWQGLDSPQALTAGNALDGDTLVVELGCRIISSDTPVPTYPPTEYSRLLIDGIGGTLFGNNTSQGVGVQDSVNGTTTATRCGWIDFSGTITEKTLPAAPTNETYAGRTVIPAALPFQSSPLVVGGATKNARTVWYEWTPTQSGNVGIFTNGSNYPVIFVVLTGTPGNFTAETDYQVSDWAGQRGIGACSFDAVSGTTYIIGIYLSSLRSQGGGELWLTMTWRDLVPAEGDLYIPNFEIYAYRDGLPINWGALNFTPAGCVIDYSGLPLTDLETGLPNTNERICIQLFGGSTLTEIIDLDTLDRNRAEVDFIFDAYNLGGDPQNAAGLAMDRANALVISHQWGNGFLDVNDNGTSVSGGNASFFDSVSDDAALSAVYRTSIQNGDNTGAPVVAAEQFSNLVVDSTTGWYGAVSDADGSILYYVSAGFYNPPRVTPASFTIRAYNLATSTDLGVIATVTCTGLYPDVGPHGLCVHSDGSIFVTAGSTVQRFSAGGTLLNTYTAAGDFPYDGQQLYDCHIHPDGQQLIAIDGETMTVFVWNINTEVQTDYFQTWLSQGNFTQFAIYQPSPLPPPGCPGDIEGAVTDGLPYSPIDVAPCGGTGTQSGSITGQ